ncbi:YciI family protein [Stappia indica]|uniref:YciI family protein n=1 Tax=Stappia indica TaxID=538381 RepID=UPI000829C5C3|nr:YciI family protein [Stappia indica]
MFVVFLKFAANRADAPRHLDGHNAWIRQGFEDGVFLLAGSLVPGGEGTGIGGAVLARGETREELEARVAADPFVKEGVVSAEIHQIAPGRTHEGLAALLA